MLRSVIIGYISLTLPKTRLCFLTDTLTQIPIGAWAKDPALKELGKFERVQMQMAVDSHTSALFTRVWNYTPEQVTLLCEGVKREFRDKNLRLITAYRFFTGRKPA